MSESYLMRDGKAGSHTAQAPKADARTVATDALATLGTILGHDEARDAVHIAVEPVVAGMQLRPGEHVGPDATGRYVPVGMGVTPLGVVDPYLQYFIGTGQRFWLLLYPGQVTSLRHVWTHPAFDAVPAPAAIAPADVLVASDADKRASEQWLRNFVERSECPSYEVLMNAATGQHHRNAHGGYEGSSNDGEYLEFHGYDAHGEIPPEFWVHVSVVSGKVIPSEQRAVWLSCSC